MPFATPRGHRAPCRPIVATAAIVTLLAGGHGSRAATKVDPRAEVKMETRGKLLDGVVNLNTAPPAVLLMLPGVGPGRVRGILAYRARRPFRTVDELVRIKGIGRRMVRDIRPHLAVTGPSTARAGPSGLEGLNALAAKPPAGAAAPPATAKVPPVVARPAGGSAVRPSARSGAAKDAARAIRARANHCASPA
jgi:hypothetical protein